MAPADGTELRPYVERLRAACAAAVVAGAGGRLEWDVHEAMKGMYRACRASALLLGELRRVSPHYARPEFLLPVDISGAPLAVPEAVLRDLRVTTEAQPDFAFWLREAEGYVLVARWLCMLSGLRHRTVELFLDHPHAPRYTLVQVRSPSKLEYGGCFDLPCAGHVVGLASVEEGLFQELAEELGLRADDLDGLRRLGAYEHAEGRAGLTPPPADVLDVEFRSVFRARLQPGALERIRFADGEVAAIAVFAVDALQVITRDQPEQIASGLGASLAMYLGS